MTNQELLANIEEWVEEHDMYLDDHDDIGYDVEGSYVVSSQSLITFIKKLLHE